MKTPNNLIKTEKTTQTGEYFHPSFFIEQNPNLPLNVVKNEKGNGKNVYKDPKDDKHYVFCKESFFNTILKNSVDNKAVLQINPTHIYFKSQNEIKSDEQKTKTKSNPQTDEKTKKLDEELEKLKKALENLHPDRIPKIRVHAHKKNVPSKGIIFKLEKLDIYALKNVVPEVQKLIDELSAPTNPIVPPNSINPPVQPVVIQKKPILNIPPILQINYKNPEKQRIKEELLKIENLKNLKFYRIKDTTELDFYKKKMKTNVANFKTHTVIYYLEADLPTIRQFLKQTRNDYEFKSIREKRNQFFFLNKQIKFAPDSLLKTDEQNAYYLDLYGKKDFKIAKKNLIGRRNNVVFVVDFLQDLSESEVKIVKKLGKKLKTNFNIEDFNALLVIFKQKQT